MSRPPIHQPPPSPVVSELVRAGLTLSTAMAMEGWKAREVLELLHSSGRGGPQREPAMPGRGSI
ncbi:MAG TPA: hypothetical protein VG520_04485 [Candidatus Dormibacteraeota bacterium]|jgi:hypothetical protein|nr:hypothetical protein [Candidatus Dormibacteraeota bacterium]